MNNSDVHTPRLSCLAPVLRRWIKLNGQLAERWRKQGDCPWWYTERALLGTFCGSVWLSDPDNVVLEEYSDSKRRRGRLTPETYTGRVDLYFEVGNQKNQKFVAESKHVWVAATSRKSQKAKIQDCIQRARRDIRQSKPDSRFRRLAIVFAAPYLKGKSPVDLEGAARWSVEQARKTDYDAMAWTFPRLGTYGEYKGGICPGVIMLLKEV